MRSTFKHWLSITIFALGTALLASSLVYPVINERDLSRPQWPFTVNWQSEQSKGLLAWWPMIEGFGKGNTARETITGTHGALNTTSLYTRADVFGSMINFDGNTTSDMLITGNTAWGSTAKTYTITFWARKGSTVTKKHYYILDISNPRFIISLGVNNPTNAAALAIYDGTWRDASSNTTWADDTLHHVSIVFDGPNTTFTSYIDGVQADTDTWTALDLHTSSGARIGSQNSGGATNVDARITDFRIYERLFTAEQAWRIYDPKTRWNSYEKPSMLLVKAPAAVTPCMRMLTGMGC